MSRGPGEISLPALPLAEQIDTGLLTAYGGQLASYTHHNRLNQRIGRACNNLEIAIATHEMSMADQAFDGLRIITNFSEADNLGKRSYLKLHLLLAWEPAFRERVQGVKPLTEPTMDHTYTNFGRVAANCLEVAMPDEVRQQILSELIALGAPLGTSDGFYFPYPVTSREWRESEVDKHNGYIFHHSGRACAKLPMWSQPVISRSNLATYQQNVRYIPMASIVRQVIKDEPVAARLLNTQKGSESARVARQLTYITELMIREARGDTPKPYEEAILNKVSDRLMGSGRALERREEKQRSAPTPLTTSLDSFAGGLSPGSGSPAN